MARAAAPRPATATAVVGDAAIEDAARALYDPALPYHNFAHAQDTVAHGMALVERCREERIRIDERVVWLGALFHDAGFRDDHRALGFASKEAYSAHLASTVLHEFGLPRRLIERVERAILATERFASFASAEEKAVRAADLAGLAADYPVFLDGTLRLRREHELLTGAPVTWQRWLPITLTVLRHYLGQEIRLTSYYYNAAGESEFHARARANLERLARETEDPDPH